MRFQSTFRDDEYSLRVTLWDKPLRELWQTTTTELAEAWGRCESAYGKAEFLAIVNAHQQQSYLFSCSISRWASSSASFAPNMQFNVSNAEEINI